MNTPLITIGILSYNAADTIQRAILSAYNQDWANKEIVIIDDASMDQSVSVIQDTIRDMPYARLVVHEKNRGTGAARNSIIENAEGECIVFFDDDDESHPERIRAQYERITQYEQEQSVSLIACYCSGERVYPNGYRYPLHAIGSQPDIPHGNGVADRLLFYGGQNKNWFFGNGTPTCSLMARKSTFESAGKFDPELKRVEDVDFAIRLALKGGHFIGCPEKLFIQYATEGADKSHERKRDAALLLVEKNKDYLKSIGMYRYAHTWPYIRYYNFTKQYGLMAGKLLYLSFYHPLRVIKHLMSTGPARILHERRMSS